MDNSDVFALCDRVREAAFSLHQYLRHGHLEKVYENGLRNRLLKAGLVVEVQHPLNVYDEDGTVLGEYFADLFVDRRLVIELKACKALTEEHIAQLLGYLRACRVEHGLLINFGSPRLQIRKYVLSASSRPTPDRRCEKPAPNGAGFAISGVGFRRQSSSSSSRPRLRSYSSTSRSNSASQVSQ